MIAGDDHVDSRLEKLVTDLLGDPESVRGVFAVGDHHVGRETRADLVQSVEHGHAARAADDISEVDDLHDRLLYAAWGRCAKRRTRCSVTIQSSD